MNILKISGLIFLVCGAYLLFDHLILPWVIADQPQHSISPAEEVPLRFSRPRKTESASPAQTSNPMQTNSRCDGRTHCSQMTSCVEAHYFLANCPDTEMDGDNDGIPCEHQWCQPPPGKRSHSFR
ncbi:MAG: excalibur calcium-binding domain-containing protein [Methylophilus sp.]|uniref:excalibur calcium-binding domain-containing protein n=1 Tax=Methylophilus sp. TaxID=29541 RepID=UPI003FA12D32